jgi:hypothetical protein
MTITDDLIQQLKAFIKENYRLRSLRFPAYIMPPADFGKVVDDMKAFIKTDWNHDTFTTLLESFRLEKNLTPVELYTGAWIDKRLYSKMMGERNYKPSKNTAISLGLSLKLTRDQMDALLAAAGFALSRSSIVDLAIIFCMEHQIYDLHDVNAVLLAVDQKVLCRE